jgi:PhzF family phenazine biosynthesis protein
MPGSKRRYSMKPLRFWQIDAFSAERFRGNPAAIIFEADVLSTDQMQTVARQFNLSETVFLCAPSDRGAADYRARIFTPGKEIPFAGHPTVASAFAHFSTRPAAGAEVGGMIRQECGAGVIVIEVSDGPLFTLSANAEPVVTTRLSRSQVAEMLGCSPADVGEEPAEICSIGLPWLIARVDSLGALQEAIPDLNLITTICREHRAIGITVYCVSAVLDGCSLHIRTFAPGVGIREDPVCGSGNGAVAVHLARHLYRDRPTFSYRAEQGLEIHRRGILHLSVERGDEGGSLAVRLGGQAVKVMEGQFRI